MISPKYWLSNDSYCEGGEQGQFVLRCQSHQAADSGYPARRGLAVDGLAVDGLVTGGLVAITVAPAVVAAVFRGVLEFALVLAFEHVGFACGFSVKAAASLRTRASRRSRLLRWSLFSLGFMSESVALRAGDMRPKDSVTSIMRFGSQSLSSRISAQAATNVLK